ncbi:MAG: hypothetical protein P8J50_16930 [Acidimicrobiales bacterium]|nr:hypothetical protein [Acidimicrobiales bacterium]
MSNAPGIVRHIGTRILLRDDGSVAGWIDTRDDLCDESGALQISALGCLADVIGGFACNRATPDEKWVMTGDLSLTLPVALVAGPARIEASVDSVGSSSVVAGVTVIDESVDRIVGSGSVSCRIRTAPESRPDLTPVGVVVDHAVAVETSSLAEHLRLREHENGVALDLRDELTNPWGILHGGVTIMGAVEAASRAHGGPGRPASILIRYLSPGRGGPIVFSVSTMVPGDLALVRVDVVDAGDADRLVAQVDVHFARREQGAGR